MSRRLPTNRSRRSASSRMVASSSSICLLSYKARPAMSDVAAPRIDARGVRRSWESEVSIAMRSLSASARTLASSARATRVERSMASAVWSSKASSNRLSSGVNIERSSGRCSPATATMPSPVRMGKNSRFAPGRVSAWRPAGCAWFQHHAAAARSCASSSSSGGNPPRTSGLLVTGLGNRITTLVFSMEAIWNDAAHKISSRRAMPASLPVNRNSSVITVARAAARSAWARTRAARLPAITATNSRTPNDSQLLGSEIVKE